MRWGLLYRSVQCARDVRVYWYACAAVSVHCVSTQTQRGKKHQHWPQGCLGAGGTGGQSWTQPRPGGPSLQSGVTGAQQRVRLPPHPGLPPRVQTAAKGTRVGTEPSCKEWALLPLTGLGTLGTPWAAVTCSGQGQGLGDRTSLWSSLCHSRTTSQPCRPLGYSRASLYGPMEGTPPTLACDPHSHQVPTSFFKLRSIFYIPEATGPSLPLIKMHVL